MEIAEIQNCSLALTSIFKNWPSQVGMSLLHPMPSGSLALSTALWSFDDPQGAAPWQHQNSRGDNKANDPESKGCNNLPL